MRNFKIINFAIEHKKPDYKINKSKGFIQWGTNNNYPEELLDMFNFEGSNLHQSIINKKTQMIAGNGIVPTAENQTIVDNEFNEDDLDIIAYKLAYDYELFNGFAYEIIYSRDGKSIAEVNHIPFQNVRRGVKNDEIDYEYFWLSSDWTKYRKGEYEPEFIKGYDKTDTRSKQLVYVMDYNPQAQIYPIPYYSNAINWISLDWHIGQFHLANAENGYSPSVILNFSTGIPTEEEMDDFERDFDRKYKGSQNAGKMVLTFSNGQDEKPELIPVQLNDSDERFLLLDKQVQQNVLTAHNVTSPTLFGIYQPSALGSKNEMIEALDIFNSTYVSKRQTKIEKNLTRVLGVDIELEPFVLENLEVVEDTPAEAEELNNKKIIL